MTFTVGQRVPTRDGRNARVIWDNPLVALVTRDGIQTAFQYLSGGRYEATIEHPLDLIPPKRAGTFWVNVWPNGLPGSGYETRESADETAGKECLACIEVHWTEGDGL